MLGRLGFSALQQNFDNSRLLRTGFQPLRTFQQKVYLYTIFLSKKRTFQVLSSPITSSAALFLTQFSWHCIFYFHAFVVILG